MAKIDIDSIAQTVADSNPSCRNPQKIAQRYVDTVKKHILNGISRSNEEQLLLGWFPISLDNLKNECGKFQPNNQFYFKILHHAHPLFSVVSKGSNLKGKQTVAETDIPLDILLAGGDAKNLVKAIYKDIDPQNPPEIEFVPIDIQNLSNYVNRLKTYEPNNTNLRNIRDGVLILTIAKQNDGHLPMVVNESVFGRRYYRGLNLQSCSKELREAALGSVWSLDISNAVFNWRYANFHKDGQKLLINTRTYLLDKARIRKKLAHAVFGNSSEYSINTIKRVMTAISFGARGETNCWYRNSAGAWVQGSVSEIIKSPELRKNLFAFADIEFSMIEFMHEQEIITQYLLKHRYKEQLALPEIRKLCLTESGKRVSEKKFLALMYQQDERALMEHLNNWSRSQRLLLVHDGAYYATKPDIWSMNSELQTQWPLACLDLNKTEPWQYVYTEEEQEEIDNHLDFIRQEEIKANNGVDPKTTGIHTETLAAKKYDPHSEPDWEKEQMEEYYKHFPEPDPNMPEFARTRLQNKTKPLPYNPNRSVQ